MTVMSGELPAVQASGLPGGLGGQREEIGEPACHSLKWFQPPQKEDLASVSPGKAK